MPMIRSSAQKHSSTSEVQLMILLIFLSRAVLKGTLPMLFKNTARIILHEWLFSMDTKSEWILDNTYHPSFTAFGSRLIIEWRNIIYLDTISRDEEVQQYLSHFYSTVKTHLTPLVDETISYAFANSIVLMLLFWMGDATIMAWDTSIETIGQEKDEEKIKIHTTMLNSIAQKTLSPYIISVMECRAREFKNKEMLERYDIVKYERPY